MNVIKLLPLAAFVVSLELYSVPVQAQSDWEQVETGDGYLVDYEEYPPDADYCVYTDDEASVCEEEPTIEFYDDSSGNDDEGNTRGDFEDHAYWMLRDGLIPGIAGAAGGATAGPAGAAVGGAAGFIGGAAQGCVNCHAPQEL